MSKINKGDAMIVVSLFDGMACGLEALKRAGIQVSEYHAFEIDKYAIQIAKKNHPEIIHHGEINFMTDFSHFKGADLLIGGSPCQGFSMAGKGLNFKDKRSQLFFEYLRAKNEIKPKRFLLENVKMKKEIQDEISRLMGCQPVFINSALVSAQNRQRLYWCNWKVNQPEDKGIYWGDIRERGINARKFYYTEKAIEWLNRHSLRTSKALKVHANNEKMQMIEASHHKKYSAQRFFGIIDYPDDESLIGAMRGRRINENGARDDYETSIPLVQYVEVRKDQKSNTVTTVQKDNIVIIGNAPRRSLDEVAFRYITPIECERLQTVADNYTAGVSDSQRYRMLGNGWTVDVIAHILKQSIT